MSCDCREQMIELLREHFAKREGVHSVDAVELEGYGLALSGNKMELRGRMDATVRGQVKLKSGATKPKKFSTFIAFSHCPFCGKPVEEESQQ